MTSDPLDVVTRGDRREGRCLAGSGLRIFGGHTLAHATCEAGAVARPDRRIASLHAMFIGPGDSRRPVGYFASSLKSGRSLDIIEVRAAQDDRTILTATLGLHIAEPGKDYQVPAPRPTPPEQCEPAGNPGPPRSTAVRQPFDIRVAVLGDDHDTTMSTWVRLRRRLPDAAGAVRHAAWLAYAVDFLITRPALERPLHRAMHTTEASLDHAMWFRRPARVDRWLLVRADVASAAGSRSLCRAEVLSRSGTLMATAVRESYIR